MEFLSSLLHAVPVGRIDNEDETLSTYIASPSVYCLANVLGELTAEVMPPQRSNLVLATNIPDVKLDVLVRDSLDVEADSRDGGDVLAELELVEDSCLSGGVETEHQQAHLL